MALTYPNRDPLEFLTPKGRVGNPFKPFETKKAASIWEKLRQASMIREEVKGNVTRALPALRDTLAEQERKKREAAQRASRLHDEEIRRLQDMARPKDVPRPSDTVLREEERLRQLDVERNRRTFKEVEQRLEPRFVTPLTPKPSPVDEQMERSAETFTKQLREQRQAVVDEWTKQIFAQERAGKTLFEEIEAGKKIRAYAEQQFDAKVGTMARTQLEEARIATQVDLQKQGFKPWQASTQFTMALSYREHLKAIADEWYAKEPRGERWDVEGEAPLPPAMEAEAQRRLKNQYGMTYGIATNPYLEIPPDFTGSKEEIKKLDADIRAGKVKTEPDISFFEQLKRAPMIGFGTALEGAAKVFEFPVAPGVGEAIRKAKGEAPEPLTFGSSFEAGKTLAGRPASRYVLQPAIAEIVKTAMSGGLIGRGLIAAGVPIPGDEAREKVYRAITSDIVEDVTAELINPVSLAMAAPFAGRGLMLIREGKVLMGSAYLADDLMGTGITPDLVRGVLRGTTLLSQKGIVAMAKIPKNVRELPVFQRMSQNLAEAWRSETGALRLGRSNELQNEVRAISLLLGDKPILEDLQDVARRVEDRVSLETNELVGDTRRRQRVIADIEQGLDSTPDNTFVRQQMDLQIAATGGDSTRFFEEGLWKTRAGLPEDVPVVTRAQALEKIGNDIRAQQNNLSRGEAGGGRLTPFKPGDEVVIRQGQDLQGNSLAGQNATLQGVDDQGNAMLTLSTGDRQGRQILMPQRVLDPVKQGRPALEETLVKKLGTRSDFVRGSDVLLQDGRFVHVGDDFAQHVDLSRHAGVDKNYEQIIDEIGSIRIGSENPNSVQIELFREPTSAQRSAIMRLAKDFPTTVIEVRNGPYISAFKPGEVRRFLDDLARNPPEQWLREGRTTELLPQVPPRALEPPLPDSPAVQAADELLRLSQRVGEDNALFFTKLSEDIKAGRVSAEDISTEGRKALSELSEGEIKDLAMDMGIDITPLLKGEASLEDLVDAIAKEIKLLPDLTEQEMRDVLTLWNTKLGWTITPEEQVRLEALENKLDDLQRPSATGEELFTSFEVAAQPLSINEADELLRLRGLERHGVQLSAEDMARLQYLTRESVPSLTKAESEELAKLRDKLSDGKLTKKETARLGELLAASGEFPRPFALIPDEADELAKLENISISKLTDKQVARLEKLRTKAFQSAAGAPPPPKPPTAEGAGISPEDASRTAATFPERPEDNDVLLALVSPDEKDIDVKIADALELWREDPAEIRKAAVRLLDNPTSFDIKNQFDGIAAWLLKTVNRAQTPFKKLYRGLDFSSAELIEFEKLVSPGTTLRVPLDSFAMIRSLADDYGDVILRVTGGRGMNLDGEEVIVSGLFVVKKATKRGKSLVVDLEPTENAARRHTELSSSTSSSGVSIDAVPVADGGVPPIPPKKPPTKRWTPEDHDSDPFWVEKYKQATSKGGPLSTRKPQVAEREVVQGLIRDAVDAGKVPKVIKQLRKRLNALDDAIIATGKKVPETPYEAAQRLAMEKGINASVTVGKLPRAPKGEVDVIGDALDRLSGEPDRLIPIVPREDFPALQPFIDQVDEAGQGVITARLRVASLEKDVKAGLRAPSVLKQAKNDLRKAYLTRAEAKRMLKGADKTAVIDDVITRARNSLFKSNNSDVMDDVLAMIEQKTKDTFKAVDIEDLSDPSRLRWARAVVQETLEGNVTGTVGKLAIEKKLFHDALSARVQKRGDALVRVLKVQIRKAESGILGGELRWTKGSLKKIEALPPEYQARILDNRDNVLIQNPEMFEGVTPELAVALNDLQVFQRQLLAVLKEWGYPIKALEEAYLKQAWKFPKHLLDQSPTIRLPGKLSIAKDRVFGNLFEGVKAGYTPADLSVSELVKISLGQVNQAMADTFFRDQIIKRWGVRGAPNRIKGFKQFQSPLYSAWSAPDWVVSQVDKLNDVNINRLVYNYSNFASALKNTMFGTLDIGLFGVQLAHTLALGGPQMLIAEINRFLNVFNLGINTHYMSLNAERIAENVANGVGLDTFHERVLDLIPFRVSTRTKMEAQLSGVQFGHGPAAIDTAASGKVHTVLNYFPFIGKPIDRTVGKLVEESAQIQFGLVLSPIRQMVYEGNLVALHLLNKVTFGLAARPISDPAVRRIAAEGANAISGASHGATFKGRRALEGTGLTSFSMVRAEINTLTQVAKIAFPPIITKVSREERVIGLMTLASFGAMIYGISAALHQAFPDVFVEPPSFSALDPRKGNFATLTYVVGGKTRHVPMIPSRGLVRAIGKSIVALGGTDEAFNAAFELDPDTVLQEIRGMSPEELSTIWAKFALSKPAPGVGGPVAAVSGIGYEEAKGGFQTTPALPWQGGMSLEGRVLKLLPIPPILQSMYTDEMFKESLGGKLDLSEADFDILVPEIAITTLGFNPYPASAWENNDQGVVMWAQLTGETNRNDGKLGREITEYNDLDFAQKKRWGETEQGKLLLVKLEEESSRRDTVESQLHELNEEDKITKTRENTNEALMIDWGRAGGGEQFRDFLKQNNATHSTTYETAAKALGINTDDYEASLNRNDVLRSEVIALDVSDFRKVNNDYDWDAFYRARDDLVAKMTPDARKAFKEKRYETGDTRLDDTLRRKDRASEDVRKWIEAPKYKDLTVKQSERVDDILDSAKKIRQMLTLRGDRDIPSVKETLQWMAEGAAGSGESRLYTYAIVSTYDQLRDTIRDTTKDTLPFTNPDLVVFYPFTYFDLDQELQDEWSARYSTRSRQQIYKGRSLAPYTEEQIAEPDKYP